MSICPTCGRGGEDIEQLVVQLRLELQDSEAERRRLLRSNGSLKAELDKRRKNSPKAAQARELFDHWVTTLGKRPNTVFGEAREKACLARLEQFSGDDLKLAIDGLAKFPFVGPQGRKESGTRKERHDDLTLVFRDETTVERFIGYAGRIEAAVLELVKAPTSEKWAPLERAVNALREHFGPAEVFLWHDGWWWAPCPACGSRTEAPFRFRRDPSQAGGVLEVQCAGGCDPRVLLAMLDDFEQQADWSRAA